MTTAVLIDGAFFVKRFRSIEPDNKYNAKRAASVACNCAWMHLTEGDRSNPRKDEMYRIFFYDCPPLEKKMHIPFAQKGIDFSKSDEAVFRRELHEELRKKRKVALRLGNLVDGEWTLKPHVISGILKGKIKTEDLTGDDVTINVRQKGVDMRIGLDIASLTFKKQVNKIILIAGDADFVPAAKLARREGIDFVLDPMWNTIPADLNEHIDGLRSVIRNPKLKGEAQQQTLPEIPLEECV